MATKQENGFEDLLASSVGFGLVLCVLVAVLAAYLLYEGAKVVSEGAAQDPGNPVLLASAAGVLGFGALALYSLWFLIPAGISLTLLLVTARVLQLHGGMLERPWSRSAFLADVLAERW